MLDQVLAPLQTIINATDHLLHEATLSDLQRKFVYTMYTEATQLRDLILAIPDPTWDKAIAALSYEGRSQLNNIIGYAEILLDDADNALQPDDQRRLVRDVRANGRRVLDTITSMTG